MLQEQTLLSVRRLLAGLLLALPIPVAAQAVTRADLVGAWALRPITGLNQSTVLTLGADSTWTVEIDNKGHGANEKYTGRPWSVSGDSLWLANGDPAATDTVFSRYLGGEIQLKWPARTFKLENDKQALALYDYRSQKYPNTYNRVARTP